MRRKPNECRIIESESVTISIINSSYNPRYTVSWNWNPKLKRMRRFPEADIVRGEIRVAFQIRTRYQEEDSEIFREVRVGRKKKEEKKTKKKKK